MNRSLKIIRNFLFDKKIRFGYLSTIGLYNWMPDELYLKKEFKLLMGRELNLKNPQTFNEKLQWLKLYNRKPEYTTMVDKYAAKQYVADRIGEQYIIPTLGVWSRFDDIDFDALPNQFVLKCTHDSGGLVICKDKSTFDKAAAKRKIEHCLRRKYYYIHREWPYKNVPPRIIAEKYMSDGVSDELSDYKLMCFNGKVKATFVCDSRFSKDGLHITFYDADWTRMPFEREGHPSSDSEINKPATYNEMIKVAEKLADKIPFLRVDFYEVKGKPYFGEMTFFPAGGNEKFKPDEWDKKLGEWINLPDGGILILNSHYTLWLHSASFEESTSLKDYKFYCFNGEPHYLYVSDHMEDHTKARVGFVDTNWEKAPFGRTDYKEFDTIPDKPDHFDDMKQLVKKLAKDVPFLRVDLYEVNGQIYFGELTFHPCAGLMPFKPEEWDEKVGELIVLPDNIGGGI